MFRTLSIALLATAALASCGSAPRRQLPREWLELQLAGIDRRQEAGDPVEDALGLGIGGGYDLVLSGPWRAGMELSAVWSRHDVDLAVQGDSDPEMDVWRLLGGARVQLDVTRRSTLHARAGGLWRGEDEDVPGVGRDQLGLYAGAGLEWWLGPDFAIGPFALYTRGADDDLEEWAFGFSARFYPALTFAED